MSGSVAYTCVVVVVTCVLGIVTTVLYIGVLLTGSETVTILVGKQAVQNTVTRAMEVNLIFISLNDIYYRLTKINISSGDANLFIDSGWWPFARKFRDECCDIEQRVLRK